MGEISPHLKLTIKHIPFSSLYAFTNIRWVWLCNCTTIVYFILWFKFIFIDWFQYPHILHDDLRTCHAQPTFKKSNLNWFPINMSLYFISYDPITQASLTKYSREWQLTQIISYLYLAGDPKIAWHAPLPQKTNYTECCMGNTIRFFRHLNMGDSKRYRRQ